jgi:hypothetical protein
MKNVSKTYDAFAQPSLPAQQTFPTAPFPRKYVHSVIDDLQQAVQAVQALQAAGYDGSRIRLFASQEFVAAFQHRLQQQSRLSDWLFRFFTSTDDGFPGDVYLHEAQRGHLILVVHLKSSEQMEQVRDLLAPTHAHHIKYIGTWTVTDLPSSAVQKGESQAVPYEMGLGTRGMPVGTPSRS